MKIEQVATDEQNADILTKMFKCVQEFDKFRSPSTGLFSTDTVSGSIAQGHRVQEL